MALEMLFQTFFPRKALSKAEVTFHIFVNSWVIALVWIKMCLHCIYFTHLHFMVVCFCAKISNNWCGNIYSFCLDIFNRFYKAAKVRSHFVSHKLFRASTACTQSKAITVFSFIKCILLIVPDYFDLFLTIGSCDTLKSYSIQILVNYSNLPHNYLCLLLFSYNRHVITFLIII